MTEMTIRFTPSGDLLRRTRELLQSAEGLSWVDSVDVESDPRHAIVTVASGALYSGEPVVVRYDVAAREFVILATPELSGQVRDSVRDDIGYWAVAHLDNSDAIFYRQNEMLLVEALIGAALSQEN